MPRKFIDIYDLQDHTEEMTTLVQKEISEGGGSGSSVKIDKEVSFPFTQENSQYIATRLLAWNELDSLSKEDLLEKDIFCLDENSEPYRTTGKEEGYKTSGDTCYVPISTANPFLYIYNDLKKNHNNYSFNYRVRHSWNFYNKVLENKYLKRITDSEEYKLYLNYSDLLENGETQILAFWKECQTLQNEAEEYYTTVCNTFSADLGESEEERGNTFFKLIRAHFQGTESLSEEEKTLLAKMEENSDFQAYLSYLDSSTLTKCFILNSGSLSDYCDQFSEHGIDSEASKIDISAEFSKEGIQTQLKTLEGENVSDEILSNFESYKERFIEAKKAYLEEGWDNVQSEISSFEEAYQYCGLKFDEEVYTYIKSLLDNYLECLTRYLGLEESSFPEFPLKFQEVLKFTQLIDHLLWEIGYPYLYDEDEDGNWIMKSLSSDDIGKTTYGCTCAVFNYLVKPDKPIFYKINNSIYEAYPAHIAGKGKAQIGWAIFQIRDAFAWHDTLNLNSDAGSWVHEIGGTSTGPFEFFGYRNSPESIFLNGGIPVVSSYEFFTSSDGCSASSYTVNPVIQAEFKIPTSSEVTMTDYEGNETTYSRLTKECTIYYASVDTSGSIATKSVTSTYDAALVTLDIPYTLESDIGKALEDF